MFFSNYRLSEIADLCLGKMLDQKKNKGDFQPYLGNSNVRWGDFDLSDLQEMRFEESEEERYGIVDGDIVMCEGGEPGRCAIWREQIPNMKIQKALHRIRAKNVDHIFLYYKLLDLGKKKFWDNFVTGTTIKHLSGKVLAQIEIAIPSMDIQRKIGRVLAIIDEKIALNQKINRNLAATSRPTVRATARFYDNRSRWSLCVDGKFAIQRRTDRLRNGDTFCLAC